MASVEYLGPMAEVYLPECGVMAARGVPAEVPDHIAGREPGEWRRALPGEVTPGGGWTALGWPLHDTQTADEDGAPVWMTHDPGDGLLAQAGAWRRAAVPSGETEPAAAAAGMEG